MANVIGAVIGVVAVLVVMSTSGCAGAELYVGTRRIDEYRAEQSTKDKPYKCLFVQCNDQGGK
jgi:hypothetical protein